MNYRQWYEKARALIRGRDGEGGPAWFDRAIPKKRHCAEEASPARPLYHRKPGDGTAHIDELKTAAAPGSYEAPAGPGGSVPHQVNSKGCATFVRTMGIAGLVLILLGAITAGGMYWMGGKIVSSYMDILPVLSEKTGFSLENITYDRGFFTSDAVTRCTIPWPDRPEAGAPPLSVELRHHIRHGPLAFFHTPGGKKTIKPVLAVVETRVVLPVETRRALGPPAEHATGDLDIRDITIVAPGGNGTNHLRIPAFAWRPGRGVTVQCKGISSDISFSAGLTLITGGTQSGGIELIADGGHLEMEDMTGRFDLVSRGRSPLTGNTSVEIARIGLRNGRAGIPAPGHMEIRRLKWLQSATVAEKLMKASISVDIDTLSVDDRRYGPGGLTVEARRLDVEALSRLERLTGEFRSAGPNVSGGLIIRFLAAMSALLERSPEFEISRMTLDTPEGDFQARAHVSLRHPGALVLFNPDAYLSAVTVRAEMDAAAEMLKKTLAVVYRLRTVRRDAMPQTAEQADLPADKKALALIGSLVSRDILILETDRYKSAISLVDGQLTVNGRPISLPEFMSP